MNGILSADEIRALVREGKIFAENFSESNLEAASYDLRIGAEIVIPFESGHQTRFLSEWPHRRYPLEPGRTVLLYSLEILRLPPDIQGVLYLRTSWAVQGLYYAGGIVEPGYWGHLFFSVTNLALDTIKLPMEAPLVSLVLHRLPHPVGQPYPEPVLNPPQHFLPPLPPREIYTITDLSYRVDELEAALAPEADRTLLPDELLELIRTQNMIEPFSEESLKGIAYDFRVGDKIILGMPEGTRHEALSDANSYVDIPPGISATVYSYEVVRMPWDVKGRLSIRSHFMAQRLNYDGGIIDPGYKGRLFFTVVNLGDTPVRLEYRQPLVTAEFIRIGREVPEERRPLHKPGFGDEPLLEVPSERVPKSAKRWYTIQDLSEQVDSLKETVRRLEQSVDKVELEQRPARVFMELFVFAALVGLFIALLGEVKASITATSTLITFASLLALLFFIIWRWRAK